MNFTHKRVPMVAVQKALFAMLSTCQTIPVYDHVPEDVADPPYITLGAMTFKPHSPKTYDIYATSIQIHIWSIYQGKAEVNDIMNDVATLIGTAALDMTADNYAVMSQEITFFEVFETENDGYHGVLTLDMLIEDHYTP